MSEGNIRIQRDTDRQVPEDVRRAVSQAGNTVVDLHSRSAEAAAPIPKRARNPWVGVAACGASYLYGSLPVVYLLGAGQALDLRRVGSGNVGATNLMAGGARALSVLGWLFDASKGYLPIAAARRLGLREDVAALAGVCGVAGQCWPIFLGFRGGRGISAFVGATAQLVDGPGWALTLAPLAGGGLWRVGARLLAESAGGRSRSVPFGCFVGAVAFPLIARWRARGDAFASPPGKASAQAPDEPSKLTNPRGTWIASLLLSAIILVRRLTAPLPDDAFVGPARRPEALLFRLLFDRNTCK